MSNLANKMIRQAAQELRAEIKGYSDPFHRGYRAGLEDLEFYFRKRLAEQKPAVEQE